MEIVTKRSVEIDATRTVMNLLIVLYHSSLLLSATGMSKVDVMAQGWFHTIEFVLPSMFFLSGYLLFRGYTFETFGRKLVSRLKRLAVPLYLVNWTIVAVVSVGVALGLIHNLKYDFEWGVTRFFCIAKGCGINPLWYLRTLLILTFLSPVIYLGLRGRVGRVVTCGIAGAWCVCEHSRGYFGDSLLKCFLPGFSILSFVLGGSFSYWTDDICRFSRRHVVPIVAAAAVSVVIIMLSHGAFYRHGVVLSLQCLFWFAFADIFVRLNHYRWFNWTGQCAFFIYVFHNPVQWTFLMRPLTRIWSVLPAPVAAFPGVFSSFHLLNFFLSVAICVFMYCGLKRVLPFLTRMLNGKL